MPKNLLLADDSVTIQKVVGMTFAGEDFSITAVDNGEDAIARARELRPDVILADVVMPRKSGYEVCEAVKTDPALRHVPVLLLAGTFEAFDEARARAVRADGHIAKPFESQALINKVKELVAGVPAHPDLGIPSVSTSPSAATVAAGRSVAAAAGATSPPPAMPGTVQPGRATAAPNYGQRPTGSPQMPAAPLPAPLPSFAPSAPRPVGSAHAPVRPTASPVRAPPAAPIPMARPPAPSPFRPPAPPPPPAKPSWGAPPAFRQAPLAPRQSPPAAAASPRPPLERHASPAGAQPTSSAAAMSPGVPNVARSQASTSVAPAVPAGLRPDPPLAGRSVSPAITPPRTAPETEWSDVDVTVTEPIPEHDELADDTVPGIAAPQARGAAPAGPVPVGSVPGIARLDSAPAGTASAAVTTERAPVPGIGRADASAAAAEPWPSSGAEALLEPIDLAPVPEARGGVAESPPPQDEQPIELADLDAEEEIELVPADVAPPLASPPSSAPKQVTTAAPQPMELRSTPAAPPTTQPAGPPTTQPGAQPAVPDGGEAALREALARASREVIEKIAWEIVPPLAETIIREHVERLVKERQH